MTKLKKEGKTPIYDNDFKIAIARAYLTSNLGYGKLAQRHGLSKGSVIYFVKWYRATYPEGESKEVATGPVGGGDEISALRQQLKEAQLKVAGYEMLLSIAQKELGIDIVKKSGTKQSAE